MCVCRCVSSAILPELSRAHDCGVDEMAMLAVVGRLEHRRVGHDGSDAGIKLSRHFAEL